MGDGFDEEPVDTQVILGKTARQPIITQTPILNAGMSLYSQTDDYQIWETRNF
ncbi:MAG: hypothetical protein JRG68_08830 [Deltaproteobacteria bacterium]|nr:hypothetical protein [Deltaproteobacteria bacterium]